MGSVVTQAPPTIRHTITMWRNSASRSVESRICSSNSGTIEAVALLFDGGVGFLQQAKSIALEDCQGKVRWTS